MRLQIKEGGPHEMPLFPLVYGADRLSKGRRVPLFYLHKNETTSFFGDDVYLTQSVSMVPLDYFVSPALQGFDCGLFAT
jgi:hypothetical protein